MSFTIKGNMRQAGRLKVTNMLPPEPVDFTNLLYTINNPNPTLNREFGRNSAISGDRAIVGVNYSSIGATYSGIAYIYDVTTGALLHTLTNPTPQANDGFGGRVAINGNRAIVGAYGDDAGATNAGRAYIYDVTTGALLHTLNNPAPEVNDYFGSGVAISGNNAIVIGRGLAYVYDVTTGSLLRTLTNPVSGDQFAQDVSMSGNIAVLVKFTDNNSITGKAYIYDVNTGTLLHTINQSVITYSKFGLGVAVNENYAVIGAYGSERVYVYNVTTGTLKTIISNPNAFGSSIDQFGYSVAIDGNNLIVGAIHEDELNYLYSGKAYIFDVETSALLHTLDNPNASGTPSSDIFGDCVRISGDKALVSARNEDGNGKVYIFGRI
jgi:WD40 repeat protein